VIYGCLIFSRVRGHNCNVFTIPALRRFSHSILYPFKDNLPPPEIIAGEIVENLLN